MKPDGQPTKPVDFDKQMLMGCSSFVAASFLCYFAWVWPFFVWQDGQNLSAVLIRCLLAGAGVSLLPALLLLGRAGLAGGCGYVAGTMAGAVFVHLRIKMIMLGLYIEDYPRPEYPESFTILIPIGMVLFAIFLVAVRFAFWKERG
jgi:ABC-type transport system involved in cytochrome c biogenesis permease subunit